MDVNFNSISNCITPLVDSIDAVENAYRSEWDDSVHESFGAYIVQAKQHIDFIVEAINSMSVIQSECESIDIDAIRSEYESIAEEVSAL